MRQSTSPTIIQPPPAWRLIVAPDARQVKRLHVPLTDQTRHLINDDTLARFRPGALLINTSRGAVVDSDALARGLRLRTLGGAALDVTEPEPLPAGSALLAAPNTLLTPHAGARTHSALRRMNAVVEDVIRVLRGEPPHYPASIPRPDNREPRSDPGG